MLIISLNINDFGGVNKHLADYDWDWNLWKKVNKTSVIFNLKKLIEAKKPSVFIVQEFELNNSDEPMSFINWMKNKGYSVKGIIPRHRISMTLFFVKFNNVSKIDVAHSVTGLTARDYAIRIDDYIIYGTHVPLNSKSRPTIREDYWEEIIKFYKRHVKEKVLLIGDFNTYDKSSDAYKKYQKLLDQGAYDLWIKLGNPDNTPTEFKYRNRLDYVFISPSVEEYVLSMNIDKNLMDVDKISDHAAILLELKEIKTIN